MNTYHVKCYETVNFTVVIEAESEEEARELAHEDIKVKYETKLQIAQAKQPDMEW